MDNRLKVKETICPGIWVDTNNELHVSISDLLDEMDLEHTDENKSIVERHVAQMIKELQPGIKFVAVSACPNCGSGDGEKHKPDCELA